MHVLYRQWYSRLQAKLATYFRTSRVRSELITHEAGLNGTLNTLPILLGFFLVLRLPFQES
jgi:hypothetical protein